MANEIVHGNFCLDAAGFKNFLQAERRSEDEIRVERMKKALRNAITYELTPRQREVIELYYFEGIKMDAIAEYLGVTKGTVSRTIKRGRLQIEKMLRYLV